MTVHLVIPDNYDVRADGTVWSLDREQTIPNRWGSMTTRKLKGKQIKPHVNKKGYHYVTLGKGFKKELHRLVAYYHVPRQDHHTQVNHIDGDKSNNKASNLEWTTQHENMQHAARLGLCGGFYGSQKLIPSEELDREILEEYSRAGSIKAMEGFKSCDRTTLGRYIKLRNLLSKHKVNQYG